MEMRVGGISPIVQCLLMCHPIIRIWCLHEEAMRSGRNVNLSACSGFTNDSTFAEALKTIQFTSCQLSLLFFFLHIFVNILLNSHTQFKSTSLIITTKENQEKRMVFCAKQVLFQLKDVATQLFLIYLFLHFQWKYNGLHEGDIFLLSWVRKCVYK